jgi:RNA-binding protein PNO1
VLAESKVHILGSFANIKMARDAICALIIGSPISKVYTNLRNASARIGHRI